LPVLILASLSNAAFNEQNVRHNTTVCLQFEQVAREKAAIAQIIGMRAIAYLSSIFLVADSRRDVHRDPKASDVLHEKCAFYPYAEKSDA
jgi:hypothetical protein